jgi:hypothetical protein
MSRGCRNPNVVQMTSSLKRSDNFMPEALVTLHLAFWLLDKARQDSHVDVAIDGAHVRITAHEAGGRSVREQTVFPMKEFLKSKECLPQSLNDEWRGTYGWKSHTFSIRSIRGFDVQGTLNGQCVKAECKGGPLTPTKGKSESAILATAIGQVVISDSIVPTDALWVAVPDSPSFEKVGTRIVNGKTFQLTGIRIVLVNVKGRVRFLN